MQLDLFVASCVSVSMCVCACVCHWVVRLFVHSHMGVKPITELWHCAAPSIIMLGNSWQIEWKRERECVQKASSFSSMTCTCLYTRIKPTKSVWQFVRVPLPQYNAVPAERLGAFIWPSCVGEYGEGENDRAPRLCIWWALRGSHKRHIWLPPRPRIPRPFNGS